MVECELFLQETQVQFPIFISGSSQWPGTSTPGDSTVFPGLHRHCKHVVYLQTGYTHACMHAQAQINFKKLKYFK